MTDYFYSIGKPGVCWGDEEKAKWLSNADKKIRSYQTEVLDKIEALRADFDVEQYGNLTVGDREYPLFSVATRNWDTSKRSVLVTGGVHGYEKSGVQGALQFCATEMLKYSENFNIICCPCVSPWGYECIQRWSANAVDPNRAFLGNVDDCPAEESKAWCMHIDMHETTDTDETEFRPAKAARDGLVPPTSEIPDGFYLVANSENEQADWQRAMIEAVSKAGVVAIPANEYHLCMSVTNAQYATTTEVYPDSTATPVTEEECNLAQVVCATSGLDYILRQ
eukprot:GSChrysophyteH1.ASY1.ANO1.383.1 assembled CDS